MIISKPRRIAALGATLTMFFSAGFVAAGSDDIVADAVASVEAGRAGTYGAPPTDGPAPEAGMTVFVISATLAAPGSAIPAVGAQEAAEALGWDVTLVDGEANPQVLTDAVSQAIAAQADAIILVVTDCEDVAASLREARDAGVIVVSALGFDCDETGAGEPLFSASLDYGAQASASEFYRAWGAQKADYAIAETDGEAKVITITTTGASAAAAANEGFVERLASCETCELLENLDIPASDLLDGSYVQRIITALQQHPDATVIHATYDALMLLGLAQGLDSSGLDLMVVGGEGFPPNIDLIRAGQETAAVAYPGEWLGYAAVDTVNRLLAGEPELPDSGFGWQIIDSQNVPETGPYVPPVDFRAGYRQAWGLE